MFVMPCLPVIPMTTSISSVPNEAEFKFLYLFIIGEPLMGLIGI